MQFLTQKQNKPRSINGADETFCENVNRTSLKLNLFVSSITLSPTFYSNQMGGGGNFTPGNLLVKATFSSRYFLS